MQPVSGRLTEPFPIQCLGLPRIAAYRGGGPISACAATLLSDVIRTPTATSTPNMGLASSPLAKRRRALCHEKPACPSSAFGRRTHKYDVVAPDYDRANLAGIIRVRNVLGVFQN